MRNYLNNIRARFFGFYIWIYFGNRPVTEIYPNIETKESSPNVVQIVSQNEIVIMVVMELIVGNSSGMINICYPVIYLESILPKLANRDIMLGGSSNTKKSRNRELNVLIKRADINVEAILGRTTLSVKELLDLKKDDIIRLDRDADDTAIVSVDKKDMFIGDIGIHRFRKSIKISKFVKSDKDEIKEYLEIVEQKRREKISTANVSSA